MPHTSPLFPTLDDSDANRTIMPVPRNDEEGDSLFRQSGASAGISAQDGMINSAHERDFYMSEPSLSEASSPSLTSNYTPMSPLNGSIQMTNSPSNTSLSSMGSPGAALVKKMIHQNYSEALTPTGTLVALYKDRDLTRNRDKNGGGKTRSNGDDTRISAGRNDDTQETKATDSYSNSNSKSQQKSLQLKVVVSNAEGDDVVSESMGVVDGVKDNTTPDSQKYLTAVESSDEGGQDTDSGFSYGSSSQEEKSMNARKEVYHFLNNPLFSNDEDFPCGSGGLDTDLLLSSNTDSGTMDTSSMGEGSPDDRKMQSVAHALIITTPPHITPFLFPEEEENITPKRKTGRPSSNNFTSHESRKTGGMTTDRVSTEADDEGNPSQRRARLPSAEKRSSSHRRTRSGDDAAATLLTGSAGWIGMEQDKLPLPNQRDSDKDQGQSRKKDGEMESNSKIGLNRRPQQRNRFSRRNSPVFNTAKNAISSNDVDFVAKDPTTLEEGISTRFSPRVSGTADGKPENQSPKTKTGMQRRPSFGEVSASTAESHFSWISNKGSSVTKGGEFSTDVDVSASTAESHFSWISNKGTNATKGGEFNTDIEASASTAESHFSWISSRGGTIDTDTKGSTDFAQFQPFHSGDDHDPAITLPRTNLPQGVHNDVEMQNEPTVETYNPRSRNLRPGYPSIRPPLIKAESSRVYPTFTCPICKTEQRQFFTVASAPNGFESPAGYLVSYFIIYMIMSLFIFGMEEGWPALDCFYFSVTTLTTAGLGDYVPTSDSAKIICSIFIYFGIACIGLLLGSLHASSLDDAAKKQTKENMINNCPGCARKKEKVKAMPIPSGTNNGLITPWKNRNGNGNRVRQRNGNLHVNTIHSNETSSLLQHDATPTSALYTMDETIHTGNIALSLGSPPQGSASPVENTGRQSHTRRYSIDANPPSMKNIFDPGYTTVNRKKSASASASGNDSTSFEHADNDTISDIDNDDQNSLMSAWSGATSPTAEDGDFFKPVTPMKAAKYVILTLKQACANSLFVIAIGSFGFYYIENLTAVDSFYFTMVLLTTVGYGDIVPKSPEGKLFAAVYGLIALGVLLHNMSKISMIPLELRKRRIEQAVLMQFGDELDNAALEELATGPLVKRLQISENSSEGLGQCTREMFAIAMLVRLGRITEQDVRSTFAAFKRLDRDNDGLLTSKEIIMSAVERKRKEQLTSPRDAVGLLPDPRLMMGTETTPLTGHLANSPLPNYMANANNGDEPKSGLGQRNRGLSFESGSTFSALTYEEGEEHWENTRGIVSIK